MTTPPHPSPMGHDSVRRGVRTFAQAFLATLVLLLPTEAITDAGVLVEVLYAAGYAALVAVVSWLHNELEDAGRVRDRR